MPLGDVEVTLDVWYIFKHMLLVKFMRTTATAPRWMPQNTTDEKSMLVG